jgi:murein DD-endopeptidase MepM/ murein hydrolase activator NlpD
MADSFGLPVGLTNGKRYYKARGMRPNGHLGEDWNGVGGGDTDLGDEVYCTANGFVVYAQDFRAGWGNVVIVRHAYLERGNLQFVDSLYGHLNAILCREGQRVVRGQKIGTIGTAHGHYPAHLHFEMRKNIHVGMFRSMFRRDYSVYWDPTQFIMTHQNAGGEGRVAEMPVSTFPNQSNYQYAQSGVVSQPVAAAPQPGDTQSVNARPGLRWSVQNPAAVVNAPTSKGKPPEKKGPWTVDRFEDIRRR